MNQSPHELQDEVWFALKRAPYPLTARELSARVPLRRQYLHRMLQSWADTGYILRERINSTLHYSMRIDASHVRPLLRRDGDVIDREPHMPGWEAQAIRKRSGLSRSDFADQIGMGGSTSVIAQMERGARPITKPVAEAIRDFCIMSAQDLTSTNAA